MTFFYLKTRKNVIPMLEKEIVNTELDSSIVYIKKIIMPPW